MTETSPKEPAPEALTTVSLTSEQNYDVVALIKPAQEALRLLEPWCSPEAKSADPRAQNIIISVKQQTVVYVEAIDMSIETSKKGYHFAQQAVSLCSFLCDDSVHPDELSSYLDELMEGTKDAHSLALETRNKFRETRVGVMKIANEILHVTGYLNIDVESAGKKAKRHETIADMTDHTSRLIISALQYTTTNSAVFGSSVGSHLAIILPAVLPIVGLLAATFEKHFRNRAARRTAQQASAKEILEMLHGMDCALQEVTKNVDAFVNWWLHTETRLQRMKTVVQNRESLGKLKSEELQRNWIAISKQYQFYVDRISMLQDLYPSVAYIKGLDTTSSQPFLATVKVECLPLTVVKPELPKVVDVSLNQLSLPEMIQSLSIQVNSCQAAMTSLGTDLVTSETLKKQLNVQELYRAMKSKLITELHDLHTFLQEMTIFPDKLTHSAIAPDHPHHEILQAQISDISKEYKARCYKLIDTHTQIRIAFASNKDQFLKCIKLQAPLRRRNTCPTIAKEKTEASNSVLEVESTLHNISVLLQSLHEFWKCRQSLLRLLDCGLPSQSETPGNDWCIIEQAILSSMKSIAGSLDSLRGSEVATGGASPWHHRYFSARA